MSVMRIRDDEPSTASVIATLALGALAGFAMGVVLAQKSGGIAGIAAGVRRRLETVDEESATQAPRYDDDGAGSEDELEDEDNEADAAAAALERRVLRAFRDDDVLRERAIDISVAADGVVELSGWVDSDEEARLAAAVTRGVEGVASVVNRIAVGDADSAIQHAKNGGRRPHDARGTHGAGAPASPDTDA